MQDVTESKLLDKLTAIYKNLDITEPENAILSLPRSLNDDAVKFKTRDSNKLKGLVFHQELGWGSVEDVARYHTGKESHLARGKGVESICYTLAIRRNGQILLCNGLNVATWSQGDKSRSGDENQEFMGVMFEGMFNGFGHKTTSSGEPTDSQLLSGLLLWKVCRSLWGWRENDLYGHYHFGKPACPGDTLKALIESVRYNTQKGKPVFRDSITYPIKEKQTALKKLDYYQGNVDGVWGNGSRGALIRFQEDYGLTPDGIWGPMTERKITAAFIKNASIQD